MNTLFITLTIASIFSQVPHAYWAINNYSRIEILWMKRAQNIIFCGIISVGILGFVLIGKHGHALVGAIVEIIINLYYYNNQFSGKGQSKIGQKIAKNWLAYFLAFVIPLMIYVFSKEIEL